MSDNLNNCYFVVVVVGGSGDKLEAEFLQSIEDHSQCAAGTTDR